MKKIVKTSIFALSTVLLLGSVTGCKKKNKDDPNTLEIYCLDAGYKTEWLVQMKDAFLEQDWVKENYPLLDIIITTNDTTDFASTKMDAGQKANTFDLMFGMSLDAFNGKEDLYDITEAVYKKKVPGEDVTYEEKMQDSFVQSFAYQAPGDYSSDPKYFFAPWAGGNSGIVYNEELLNNYLSHTPNTTDELKSVCEAYTSANYVGNGTTTYAFLQSVSEDYFNNLFRTFWGQYQGIQGYIDFYNGIDDGAVSKNIFKQKGRLEALKVMENLLDSNKHYLSPRSKIDDFMISQTSFLRGGSLFCVNGDWFVSEMAEAKASSNKKYTQKMMKTPIVSSIIDLCDSISNDAELSALITAIDSKSTSLTGTGYDVSQEDYDKIKEARSVVYSVGAIHQAIIPSYALAKDAAADFLRFMATDKAQDIYIEATKGSSLPFKYDLQAKNPTLYNSDKVDILHKERISFMNDDFNPGYTLPNHYSFPLRKWGYVEATSGDTNYYGNFIQDGSRLSAQDYYDNTIEYWTDARWSNAINLAGINN